MCPKVSVIVTVYNKEKYLRECLDSILAQTLKDIEVICVNDGSTDGSADILREFEKKNDRIYVIYQENRGQVTARKTGVSRANGKYIGFVDADDWVEPEMFERLYIYADENHLQMVSSGLIDTSNQLQFDGLETGVYDISKAAEAVFKTLFSVDGQEKPSVYGNICTKLCERQLLLDFCMHIPDKVHYREDNCWTCSALLNAEKVGIIREAFYHYRFVFDSDSRNPDLYFAEKMNHCYVYLLQCIKNSRYQDILLPQLDRFYAYSVMELFNKSSMHADALLSYEFPIYKKEKIIVYGGGVYGDQIARRIRKSKEHVLVAVADQGYQSMQDRKYPVIAPEQIMEYRFDRIVISILSRSVRESVKNMLRDMQIENDRIAFA